MRNRATKRSLLPCCFPFRQRKSERLIDSFQKDRHMADLSINKDHDAKGICETERRSRRILLSTQWNYVDISTSAPQHGKNFRRSDTSAPTGHRV